MLHLPVFNTLSQMEKDLFWVKKVKNSPSLAPVTPSTQLFNFLGKRKEGTTIVCFESSLSFLVSSVVYRSDIPPCCPNPIQTLARPRPITIKFLNPQVLLKLT